MTAVILPNLPILLAAAAFLAGGLALIASSRRTREEVLARRVGMVERSAALAGGGRRAAAADTSFLRLPTRSMSEAAQREVIRRFARFGLSPRRALTAFFLLRLAVVIVLGAVALTWAARFPALQASPATPLLIAAMVAIGGWFLPMIFVSYNVRQRTKEVRAGLPDALELLVVCVEAGLSLEDGLARVVNELKRSQPALADELELTLADLKILPSRDQALANLAERVNVTSVRSVVTTLAQTLRYGTPLVQSLRVVAAEMRNDYLIELEDKANRLPAFLTLPVIVFLMPTIFLIVGGPAALRLMDAFLNR